MLSSIPSFSFTGLALSLLLANIATSTTTNQNEPQLFSNISLINKDDGFSVFNENPSLNARALECGIGYSQCAYDTSRCCPLGGKCCGNGYCATIGQTCCTGGGTCPIGYKCCEGNTGCAPLGGECCSGGYYCPAGKQCRVYDGEKVCCPYTGCVGEYNGIGSGATLTADVTSTATETATTTYVKVDFEYYYTTIYWTYWYYYWTSYYPYTVQTVTSTTTSTRTIWSAYATNRAEATSSFMSKSSSYSFSAPYSATSLKSSTDPVTLSTGAAAPSATGSDSTNLVSAGPNIGASSADSVSISGTGILAAVLVAAIGGLAFGL